MKKKRKQKLKKPPVKQLFMRHFTTALSVNLTIGDALLRNVMIARLLIFLSIKNYFNRFFSSKRAELANPLLTARTDFVTLDSSKNVLRLLKGKVLKNGKLGFVENVFDWFLFNFKQYFGFTYPNDFEELLITDFQLPFSVGKRHSSNKVFFFPQPSKEKESWKFVLKTFSQFIKKQKRGKPFFSVLTDELIKLFFFDANSSVINALTQTVDVVYANRMFVHYRWGKRRRLFYTKRIASLKKKRRISRPRFLKSKTNRIEKLVATF